MPQFQRGDRVVLTRGCKGLPAGATGTVVRSNGAIHLDGKPGESDYWRVRWDVECVKSGPKSRDHKYTTLRLATDAPKEKVPGPPKLSGVSKRLALLQFEDAEAGLDKLVTFSDQLKEIAATKRKLSALHRQVKHVALYQGPELNLYLTIKGTDVYLVKEMNGSVSEALSVPLPVFARLINSLQSDGV